MFVIFQVKLNPAGSCYVLGYASWIWGAVLCTNVYFPCAGFLLLVAVIAVIQKGSMGEINGEAALYLCLAPLGMLASYLAAFAGLMQTTTGAIKAIGVFVFLLCFADAWFVQIGIRKKDFGGLGLGI